MGKLLISTAVVAGVVVVGAAVALGAVLHLGSRWTYLIVPAREPKSGGRNKEGT